MAANEIHKDDVGTDITLIVKEGAAVVDLSTTTDKVIKFRKTDGTIVTKTATFTTDGTDGSIYYTTVSNDLDQIGPWKVQAVVTFGTEVKNSDIVPMYVHPNLAEL